MNIIAYINKIFFPNSSRVSHEDEFFNRYVKSQLEAKEKIEQESTHVDFTETILQERREQYEPGILHSIKKFIRE